MGKAKGSPLPFPDYTAYGDVILRIRKLWNEGAVEFLEHAQDQMDARQVDALDVQQVIRFGKIISHVPPEENPSGLWRYTLRGKAVDGDKLDCVFDIDVNLVIVTVITKR